MDHPGRLRKPTGITPKNVRIINERKKGENLPNYQTSFGI